MDSEELTKAYVIFPHLSNLPDGAFIVDKDSGKGTIAEHTARYFRNARVIAMDISLLLYRR